MECSKATKCFFMTLRESLFVVCERVNTCSRMCCQYMKCSKRSLKALVTLNYFAQPTQPDPTTVHPTQQPSFGLNCESKLPPYSNSGRSKSERDHFRPMKTRSSISDCKISLPALHTNLLFRSIKTLIDWSTKMYSLCKLTKSDSNCSLCQKFSTFWFRRHLHGVQLTGIGRFVFSQISFA